MEYLRNEVLVVRYGMVPSVAFTKNPFKNPIDFGSDVTGNAKTTGFACKNTSSLQYLGKQLIIILYDACIGAIWWEATGIYVYTKTSMCLFSTWKNKQALTKHWLWLVAFGNMGVKLCLSMSRARRFGCETREKCWHWGTRHFLPITCQSRWPAPPFMVEPAFNIKLHSQSLQSPSLFQSFLRERCIFFTFCVEQNVLSVKAAQRLTTNNRQHKASVWCVVVLFTAYY